MKYKKYEIGPYNLHILKTDKFKVNRMTICFKRKVKKEEITIRNILADCLLSSTKKYNSQRLLNIKTEELYGLPYGGGVDLSGNFSIMKFSMEFLNDKYTLKPIFDEAIDFLMDILFNPNIENKTFDKITFETCKENNLNNIKSISDNTNYYSHIRLFDNLLPDSPISYHQYGYLDDIDKITPQNLYEYYLDILKKDIVDIFIIGDLDFDDVKKSIISKMKINTIKKPLGSHFIKPTNYRKRIKNIKEEKNIRQSKLAIGFKIKNPSFYEMNFVSTIYSYILGGSADSLLFKNVREKHSLCYYISSNIYKLSNTMVISSGINAKDSKKVISLVKKEIKKMSQGKFDEQCIENGKEMFISACDEIKDSISDILNMYITNEYLKIGLIDERKKEIMKVTKKDIMKFAEKIIIDTTYLLEGSDEDGNK